MTDPVLVLRGSNNGWIHGLGIGDGWRPAFHFPTVGERFEAPGRELVAIKRGDEPHVQHEHGLHGLAWGRTNREPGSLGDVNRWRHGDWLILEAAGRDVVYDKGRTTGKCRCKDGTVRYIGDLAGAVEYMREHWPKGAGPSPDWEDDPYLFPRPPVVKPPPSFTIDRRGWRLPVWKN